MSAIKIDLTHVISAAFQIYFSKGGTFTTYITPGVKETVTIQEVGTHTTPIGHFTFGQAVTLAETVLLAHQPGTQIVRLGADDYSVTVTIG